MRPHPAAADTIRNLIAAVPDDRLGRARDFRLPAKIEVATARITDQGRRIMARSRK
jgi:hypothetical protein